MSTEEKKQNQDSWKEITFLGIALVFMLVILYFSVRMTMRLAEPLNAVKYGAWHAMKFDEMQKRMDAIEERLRKLEVDGKKMTFSSDGIMYGAGIMIGTENMQRENEGRTVEMMEGK